MPSRVWVVGSAVLDHVYRVRVLPTHGQSVFAQGTARFLGGKGSNQAVAASRAGAKVTIVGCLGQDPAGDEFLAAYQAEGLDTAHVCRHPFLPTGSATVTVAQDGLNQIVVDVGANHGLTAQDLLRAPVQEKDYVLCQLEVLDEVVRAASTRGRLILNSAPMRSFPKEVLRGLFALVPNESEASELVGYPVHDLDTAQKAAKDLLSLGAQNVLITLGRRGVYWLSPENEAHFPAPAVQSVDTTGAGDVFNGSFAARLSLGDTVPQAAQYAVVAASLSVTRPGAIASIPTHDETLASLPQTLV